MRVVMLTGDTRSTAEAVAKQLGIDEIQARVRLTLQSLRRRYMLTEDLAQPIKDYDQFRAELDGVQYAGRLATQTS